MTVSWEADFKRLRALNGVKWTHHPADVIPAWVADMDLPQAPAIIAAVRKLVDDGDFGYNFSAARRLPVAFAKRQEERFGWRSEPKENRLFCDVLQAVDVALWAHTEPGDGVVLFTPVYAPFYAAIEAAGCRLIDVPLEPGTWCLDPERLEAAIDARTRAILTCDPHNPTGRSFTREELAAIAEIAERHDLLVISDEIWADLVYTDAPAHTPFASLSPETERRTITVAAASKAFNLAGLRCAIAHLGHPQIAEKIAALPGHLLGAVGSPGAEATLAAWTRSDEWLAETCAHLQANRDHLAARLAAELPEVGLRVPEATYLAWLDFSATGIAEDPAGYLLEHARVALSCGGDFGASGSAFARMNFATTRTLLDESIDRIVRATKQSSPA